MRVCVHEEEKETLATYDVCSVYSIITTCIHSIVNYHPIVEDYTIFIPIVQRQFLFPNSKLS